MSRSDPDVARPPVPSKWRRLDRIDPSGQLYDDADCDSWLVPGELSTGPFDYPWKGDYDRDGTWARAYGARGGDCDAPRCALSGPYPYYTPCTYADCDLELGGGCVLRGPPA